MSLLTFATRQIAGRVLPARLYREQVADPRNGDHASRRVLRYPVCLTFDDGPHPDFTPRILDQLAAHGARATFFLIGRKAEQQPQLVQRIVAEGHAVGSHTWSHLRAVDATPREYLEDAIRGRGAVEAVTGQPCPLFRPPHGELTPLSLLRLIRNGFQIVRWSLEPKDSDAPDRAALNSWFAANNPFPGCVVLLHDTCRLTVDCLPTLLRSWNGKTRFETVPQQEAFV